MSRATKATLKTLRTKWRKLKAQRDAIDRQLATILHEARKLFPNAAQFKEWIMDETTGLGEHGKTASMLVRIAEAGGFDALTEDVWVAAGGWNGVKAITAVKGGERQVARAATLILKQVENKRNGNPYAGNSVRNCLIANGYKLSTKGRESNTMRTIDLHRDIAILVRFVQDIVDQYELPGFTMPEDLARVLSGPTLNKVQKALKA